MLSPTLAQWHGVSLFARLASRSGRSLRSPARSGCRRFASSQLMRRAGCGCRCPPRRVFLTHVCLFLRQAFRVCSQDALIIKQEANFRSLPLIPRVLRRLDRAGLMPWPPARRAANSPHTRWAVGPAYVSTASRRQSSCLVEARAFPSQLFLSLLTDLSQGNFVTFIPTHGESANQRAADQLDISRPYIDRLLEAEKNPGRGVDKNCRVWLDVLWLQSEWTERIEAEVELRSDGSECPAIGFNPVRGEAFRAGWLGRFVIKPQTLNSSLLHASAGVELIVSDLTCCITSRSVVGVHFWHHRLRCRRAS